MAVGVAVAVLGTARFVFGPTVIEDTGKFAIGRVVDVAGDRVELSYMLEKVERRGFAYPEGAENYQVGAVVRASVLPDRPDRVVIDGTEPPPAWLGWARILSEVAGLLIVLVGLGTVIRSFARWGALSPAFPRVRWISERHGG